MKLIIPMAGRGKRLRPQSNVTPKPLLSVAGKTVVERIVEGFAGILPRPVTEAVFILGPSFGQSVRTSLADICERHGIEPHYVIQHSPLGTAHAVSVARDYLSGEGIVIYADTVFVMGDPVTLEGADVVAWVKKVDDPSRFGVAVREGDRVVAFVEKPKTLISREALIGIYYVRELGSLQRAIQHLFDNEIKGKGGEYYLTDAFDLLLKRGQVFLTATVREWLDCGTLEALFDTTCRLLGGGDHAEASVEGSVIIEPVHLGPGAQVKDSVVGPNVSVERDARIENSVVRDSIVFEGACVRSAVLARSFVGAHATVEGRPLAANVGDHSLVE